MESEANSFRVEFPDFSCSILHKLNQQRQLGQLCDITVVIQGHRFRAHKAVLAASSPYFCDQVLLKNSMRVVLPDVMHPNVFESLLQSCYTGTILLPVGEIVGFLTAASFLQMWHVVDKCTELLGGNPSVLCQKSGSGSDRPSPGDSSYNSPSEGFDLAPASGPESFGKTSGYKDTEMELLEENCFSPQGLDQDAPLSSSPLSEQDRASTELASQDGEDGPSDVTDYQYSRPIYMQPSIMYRKRWIQVKNERSDQEDCGVPEEPGGAGRDPADPAEEELEASSSSLGTNAEERRATPLEDTQEREPLYDEPLDFYGASMEEFSGDKADGALPSPAEEMSGGGAEPAGGVQKETSHSGFASVVYKLYPCQCGKSFTHKSQRDRHMGMHLGLRPYGCGVCGKKFKMKHHLVGHMKIHTGIKPYECNICRKRFMWRDSFHRHVASCTRAYQAKHAAAEQAATIC